MTISCANEISNRFLRTVRSSVENLDSIATKTLSDDNVMERLQRIYRKFAYVTYPLSIKFALYSEYGVSHLYSLSDRIKTCNILLEYRLILNDIFTRIIFRDLEKKCLNKYFLEVKSKLLKSDSGSDYKCLLLKIDSVSSKLLKEKASPVWRMRIYRILQHVLVDQEGLREVKIDDITVENIIRCANIIRRENSVVPNERITPRHLDVLSAAKLILDETPSKDKFDLSFDPETFEKGDFETRADIQEKFIYLRAYNSTFSKQSKRKKLSQNIRVLSHFLSNNPDMVFDEIKNGSKKKDLVQEKSKHTWLVRCFRILSWDMRKSKNSELKVEDIDISNILKLSKEFLTRACSHEEDRSSIQHETLEAAVSFLEIAKDLDVETSKMLKDIKSKYPDLI